MLAVPLVLRKTVGSLVTQTLKRARGNHFRQASNSAGSTPSALHILSMVRIVGLYVSLLAIDSIVSSLSPARFASSG